MKLASVKLLCSLIFSLFFISASAQNFFRDAPESSMKLTSQKRVIIPQKYRTLQLDTTSISSFLRLAPSENKISNRDMTPEISIPMPDGTIARFHIWESSVLAPELAAANPNIKTFTGQGIDDRTATIKIDWTEFGFHAMISSSVTGDVFIDPYDIKTVTHYITYFKTDYNKAVKFREYAPRISQEFLRKQQAITPDNVQAAICLGTQLRTYRLAVACTGEYAVAVTSPAAPTKPAVLAKIVTTVNRVNGIYEKELSIRMVLVATENNIIFINPSTDPFIGNADGFTLIDESQQVIDSLIVNANYDIGHTFSTGGGGVAWIGVVCIVGQKAYGVTGRDDPTGDRYDVDYVAHEIGHQFGGNHTFNSNQGFCGENSQWSPITNAEPGSGSTIMAYAGICDTDNLQDTSEAQFHTISFDEIGSFITTVSPNCAAVTTTGNTVPTVNAPASYIIPTSTPFVLTGSATDPNASDVLTYSWEQADVGGPTGVWNAPAGDAPLFRSFKPASTPVRYFPRLSNQISGTSTIGEILPTYERTMHFRLTTRDNRAGGGGVCYAATTVTTVATAAPFMVTSPSASGIVWNVNEFQTVTWNPAGTALAPISATNVAIQLSTDGGLTFPTTILASTPNDGTEEIQVPNNITTQARIRVIAVGNIFYDFSNNNFTIQTAPTATFVFNNPVPVKICSGTSGVATLKSGALRGFATTIALTASQNPAGTTVSFGTASLTPGNSTTVTLNNTGALAPGAYNVRVTGVAGAVTKTRDISFVIGAPAAPALSTPANDVSAVVINPSFNWALIVGADSYTLEISTSPTFSAITQSISGIISLPVTLTTALAENTIYYWRVKSTNTCGTGTASAGFRFKTGFSSCFPSTDVPKDISATGTPSITSTITIPAAKGVIITDLNLVDVMGFHSYFYELRFTLTGPDNTSVIVINPACDAPTDPFNFNLDDQGPATFTCPLVDGIILRPANPLSAFIGKSSAGTWTLKIDDLVNGEGGQLQGWGLSFNSGSINCATIGTPVSTTYTFTGNGNWNTASNWSNNTIPPLTLPSGGSIVINHAAGGQCVLNLSQTVLAGGSVTVLTGKNLVVSGALTIK